MGEAKDTDDAALTQRLQQNVRIAGVRERPNIVLVEKHPLLVARRRGRLGLETPVSVSG